MSFYARRHKGRKSYHNKATTNASKTPTATQDGSSTTADTPRHPTPPTGADSISQVFFRTWSERVVAASIDVWSMYPTDMQVKAITSLIDIDVCGGKLLLVAKTGAGKSHVMRATGVMWGGVGLLYTSDAADE